MKKSTEKTRCVWPKDDPRMIEYHDREWGVPQHDDKILFEYIVLDTFQAGLSWAIVLKKRGGFSNAFKCFEVHKVAKMSDKDVERLMKDVNIVRNRLKIAGTIKNAKAFIAIQKEYGSFGKYLWAFVGNKTIVNKHKISSSIGTHSKESDALSADMKKRGFTFVGTTICYAFMQGAGLVNDHLVSCFRYSQLQHKK
jgi:DNA-3-methyladenine glycosylase I